MSGQHTARCLNCGKFWQVGDCVPSFCSTECEQEWERTKSELNEQYEVEMKPKFLLWNKTAGYTGNSPLFWKAGGCGYTQWLGESHRFFEDEADSLIRTSRGTHDLVKVPVELAEKLAKLTVDVQELNAELATELQ